MFSNLDQVVLVSSDDQVIGSMDKFEAHRHPAQLHRAISVWMIDQAGRLLFQQRSSQKITGGQQWGNTVCGNVWPAESYQDCAFRRLKVELGIENVPLTEVEKFQYQAYANAEYSENEIDQLYISEVDSAQLEMTLNPEEVIDVLWIDKNAFFTEIEKFLKNFEDQHGRPLPTAAETITMTTEELRQLTPPAQIWVEGRELTIVPWTVLMVQLPSLRDLFL